MTKLTTVSAIPKQRNDEDQLTLKLVISFPVRKGGGGEGKCLYNKNVTESSKNCPACQGYPSCRGETSSRSSCKRLLEFSKK